MKNGSIANRTSIRKICIASILVAAILTTMIVIFLFSSEGPSESGDRSLSVTMQIARIFYPDFDEMTRTEQMRMVNDLHFAVRKGAHFAVYALLGGLVMTALVVLLAFRTRFKRRLLCLSGIAAAIGLAYAISDEVHQKFVGRGASPKDVCIDFAGVLFGIAVVWGISHVVRRAHGCRSADKGEGSI